MNIFNYIFYRLYKSTAKVNDLYPEIPTIIFLSTLIFLNIYSAFLLTNISNNIELNHVYLLITIILIFNFYYFLKNDKYKLIIEEFDSQKKNIFFLDVLIFLYPFISFGLCFKLLKMTNGEVGFTLGGLLIIEIVAHLSKKKE